MIAKGSKRLLFALSALWLLAIVVAVSVEYKSIDSFESFDQAPPQHIFWKWQQVEPASVNGIGWDSPAEVNLYIKPALVISAAVVPILMLWLLAWSIMRARESKKRDK